MLKRFIVTLSALLVMCGVYTFAPLANAVDVNPEDLLTADVAPEGSQPVDDASEQAPKTTQSLELQSIAPQSMAGWNAGYIISDTVMSNNSMDVNSIQNFLNSAGAGCNSNCLKNTYNGAQAIKNAANNYNINPQVLIVLLQKETSLVTMNNPEEWRYRTAVGYGCPDGAPCDAQYYGLDNQLNRAAQLFRTVLDGGWSNYPVGVNYIQYNPNAGCGGTNVNILNRATSALYRYTPYQPNQAAINGGGDGCSSWGNRNFFSTFSDWFGNPQTGGFFPDGHVDEITSLGNGDVKVRGWTFDRDDTNASIQAHVYVGGPAGTASAGCGATTANLDSTDVNNAFSIAGNHRFEFTCNTRFRGSLPVYVYGINIGPGSSTIIGQGKVSIACTDLCPVYRVYNTRTGAHHSTQDSNEYLTLTNDGWNFEGISWFTPTSGKEVSRLYHPISGEHLWTMDQNEVRVLTSQAGWIHEGRAWYAANTVTNSPVYRLFNIVTGEHLYTADKNEVNVLSSENDWNNEGILYYAY
ncbi:hypothetical protein FACS1894125_0890 [Actinomycetota bacterium]|nr:hypothetical protein FACS1894125_0890 [Actinomycetota bacterium]